MGITKDNTAKFSAAMKKAAVAGVDDASRVVVAKARASMEGRGSRFTPSSPGTPPHVQRGQLWRSIQIQPARILFGKVIGRAGSNLNSSRIHELGGTIRAKRGRFLSKPINPEAKRLSETNSGSLRNKDMFVMRTPRGKLLLVGKSKVKYRNKAQGIRLSGEPVFALVKSVRMPKRPYMVPALVAATKDGSLYKALFTGTRGAIKQFSAGLA